MRSLSLLPLLALGGCGVEQLLFGRPTAPPPPEPLPPTRSDVSQADLSAGLAPLSTPQQVLTAVPFGRTDPFASVTPPPVATAAAAGAKGSGRGTAPGASSPGSSAAGKAAAGAATTAARVAPMAPLKAPDGFRLTGVIQSGGQAEALVSFGGASGSLRLGDRGGRTTGLLPSGWVLASIQFGGRTPEVPPSVTLWQAGKTVKVSL